MKIGGILLARLDSSRLPGKQLRTALGRPLMEYIIERAMRVGGVDRLVLATTDREVDDPLVEWADDKGLASFRGSAQNVAERVLLCLQHFGFDAFVRLNCDSPLMDFELLSRGVEIFLEGKYDIVTNTFPRSYPVGNSVEVFGREVFAGGYEKMHDPSHFEHVTKYFYDHPEEYRIWNMAHPGPSLQRVHLAVDMPEDLERFQRLLTAMNGRHLDYFGQKLIDLYDAQAEKTD